MKRKQWIISVMILATLVTVFGFRDSLAVRLFPKTVLTGAIGEIFADFEERFAASPIALVAGAMDKQGCQHVRMKLDTGTQFMGIAHYDMEFHTQSGPNRISGSGTVSTGAGAFDLNLYLDNHAAALASDSLTDGAWYGITYDSFPSDIRSFQLLGLLLGDDILKEWDASVSDLASWMGRSYSLPQLNMQDLRTVLLGTLTLKPMVEREEGKHCYRLVFNTCGPELNQKAQPYLDQAPEDLAKLVRRMAGDPESELKLVFHLDKRKLIGMDVSLTLSGVAYDAKFSMEGKQLCAVFVHWDGENLDRREFTLETAADESAYQENLLFIHTENGIRSQLSAAYAWDLSSGDMSMEVERNGKQYPVRLNLKREGQNLYFSCQQFEQVLSLLTGKEKNQPAICTLILSPGEPVSAAVDYKNLSDWSLEDMYLLLTRVGTLVGIHLP